MRHLLNAPLAAAAAVTLSILPGGRLAAQDRPPTSAAPSLQLQVTDALALSKSMGFGAARQGLQLLLQDCAPGGSGNDCRTFVNYSLGYLYQTEASASGEPADSLLRRAVDHYDQAVAADSENWQARYNKALVYRAMGALESQESFFKEAAAADGPRRATFLSLLGDYYLERQLPAAAAEAYRAALAVNPDEDGARSGLIEAYRSMGPPGLRPLFEQAEQWRAGFESSADEAYAVLLEEAIGANDRTMTDTACIRLVALQTNITGPFLTVRPDIPSARGWGPAQQVDRFMASPAQDSVPWWRRSTERSSALARAALQRGSAAAAEGKLDEAEQYFRVGLGLAAQRSAEAVDIQRELALLYTRNASLDPRGERFGRLENSIFQQKEVVLASHDLEAAQRFHTTLALIYAERDAWPRRIPYRNALDQLEMALRAAAGRAREQRFFQPLPELRTLLAQGQQRTGERERAAATAVTAVRAWLDVDDVAAADSMLGVARSLGAAGSELDRLAALARLRSSITAASAEAADTAAGAAARARCAADPTSSVAGTGPADFERRQRFKILSDCGGYEPALGAFAAADTTGFTLIGLPDVRRFQHVINWAARVGGWDVPGRQRPRLVTAPVPRTASFTVSLRNETLPRWLAVDPGEVMGARVLRVLSAARATARIEPATGRVFLRGAVPQELVRQLTAVPGVSSVLSGGGPRP